MANNEIDLLMKYWRESLLEAADMSRGKVNMEKYPCVKQWAEALHEAASISGVVVLNTSNQVHISRSESSSKSLLIQMGMNCKGSNILKESILKNMTLSESDGGLLPCDNYPDWLTFNGDGSSCLHRRQSNPSSPHHREPKELDQIKTLSRLFVLEFVANKVNSPVANLEIEERGGFQSHSRREKGVRVCEESTEVSEKVCNANFLLFVTSCCALQGEREKALSSGAKSNKNWENLIQGMNL
ncbi:hypothetical protein VNO78_25960 [Psophocarpus tetragonolobus]|uniref:Uncharacterized protein n=1 Tax=Psophocarpus tetragonolobus TaxID=3891 RepID=A0AAN9XFW4_PSOTE